MTGRAKVYGGNLARGYRAPVPDFAGGTGPHPQRKEGEQWRRTVVGCSTTPSGPIPYSRASFTRLIFEARYDAWPPEAGMATSFVMRASPCWVAEDRRHPLG